jgi:hypothetical protein
MRRAVFIAVLLAAASAVDAGAQTPPAGAPVPSPAEAASPRSASTRGAPISRDDYIAQAVERARKSAAVRFDKMDANHDGILTVDERRAHREAQRAARAAQ